MPEICLEYVERDKNYVTVTDAYGLAHYIDNHFIDDELIKKIEAGNIEAGDDILINLPQNYIDNNGIVE